MTNGFIDEAVRWYNYEAALRNKTLPADDAYFEELCRACLAYDSRLEADTLLYRARINPPERESEPLPIDDMGQPPPEKVEDGRVNRKGSPCFYAARDPETSIAEKRPWRLATVSVATFTVTRPYRVLDLRTQTIGEHSNPAYWASFMIQRPVHRKDALAYLGTQLLAERFKAAGFGGLLYDSALSPNKDGTNVALFSDTGLKGSEDVALYAVWDVKYTTERQPSL
jgi:hypothetical protein